MAEKYDYNHYYNNLIIQKHSSVSWVIIIKFCNKKLTMGGGGVLGGKTGGYKYVT